MRPILPLLFLAATPFLLGAAPEKKAPARPVAKAPAKKPVAKPTARPAARTAVPAIDWTTRIATTPIGGHVMGNPAAPTKVVEYLSYTCIHCATLTNEGSAELKKNWVRGGTVSIEIRNLVRDAFDMTAALLARCGGQSRFFGNYEALFGNYNSWIPQFRKYDDVAADMEGKPIEQVFATIADKTGLFALMQQRGFTRPQLVACINDKASRQKILAMTDEATEKLQIGGTPGVVINGKLAGIGTWEQLKAALPPAKS